MASKSTHKFLKQQNKISIIGAKVYKGAMKAGPEAGPEALMNSGLIQRLTENLSYEVDYDGVDYHTPNFSIDSEETFSNMSLPRSVSAITEDLSIRVSEAINKGNSVLTLGGDHCIGLGTVTGAAAAARQAFQKQTIGIIWVDAHGDINTPSQSSSGHLHGMPLAWALGLAKSKDADIFGWIQDKHIIAADKLVYIGVRDLDQTEKETIRKLNIKAFTMNDVMHLGIKEVMDQTLVHIGSDIPIHMSFDIDGLDPVWAPGTGLPVDGGLSLAEGNYLAARIYDTQQMVSMDLVEVSPGFDHDQKTIRSAVSIILHAFGYKQL